MNRAYFLATEKQIKKFRQPDLVRMVRVGNCAEIQNVYFFGTLPEFEDAFRRAKLDVVQYGVHAS